MVGRKLVFEIQLGLLIVSSSFSWYALAKGFNVNLCHISLRCYDYCFARPSQADAVRPRVVTLVRNVEDLQARRGAGNGGSTLCEPADRLAARSPPDRS